MSIPDQMSEWAISRLPGETDASMRERIRHEGMPLFCLATPWVGVPPKHGLMHVLDVLYTAKAGGYFTPYMDPTLSNLANAERCAEAARALVEGELDEGVAVKVVNYSDGFRIEVGLQREGDA